MDSENERPEEFDELEFEVGNVVEADTFEFIRYYMNEGTKILIYYIYNFITFTFPYKYRKEMKIMHYFQRSTRKFWRKPAMWIIIGKGRVSYLKERDTDTVGETTFGRIGSKTTISPI